MSSIENPLGLLGIESLEICSQSSGDYVPLMELMGMALVSERPQTKTLHYQQNRIHFFLSGDTNPQSPSRRYFEKHGAGVYQINFLVKNTKKALEEALKRGANLLQDYKEEATPQGIYAYATIQGFGDVQNQFVQSPKVDGNSFHSLRHDFTPIPHPTINSPLSQPLLTLDHLTNNVPKGEMEHWVDFYVKIFGLQVTRYFDIKGLKTGLLSKVVQMPGTNITIPINEPEKEGGKSQIQEFLDIHKGAGVQHIAFTTTNILKTVANLRERNMKFLDVPQTYYEDIPKRNFHLTENIADLAKQKILVDGDSLGHLLQIFTDTYIGPSFFEFIQRKNHLGFGEGNFQALFDSIERDQIQRGYLR